ncbi:MAG TPA: PadR family transcriptional regulator [Candidatus Binatia bacterium]|nr:PadR family transcriptional regulator [Candidatus Binatia bacterium]
MHHGPPWPSWRHALRAAFGPIGAGGPTVKRGIIRIAVLRSLSDGPKHGYQIIQDLEARTGGFWRPSAGSIYPTLQQLEDEGLVRSEERDGRRTYVLTEEGQRAAEALGTAPAERFFAGRRGPGTEGLRVLAAQLVAAAVQVERVGSAEARSRAEALLRDTRRQLYRLLAEDDAATEAAPGEPPSASGQPRPGGSEGAEA